MAKTTVDEILVKIQGDMSQLEKALKKSEQKTQSSSAKMKRAFSDIGSTITTISKRITLIGGAVAGAFGAMQVRRVVQVGMEIEGLQVRLKNLFGSAQAGQNAFNELAKFAAKVPFSLQEIQQGAGSLAVVAQDAEHLSRLLTITGNAAALTGLDFATASAQIQRAFAGGAAASDLFRERGLNALLGFKQGATTTAEETARVFEENLGASGKFGKTTDELAQTLTGTLSMIGDKVFNFQRLIADEKFFGTVKKSFENLNNSLAENQDSLDKLSAALGTGLSNALEKAVKGLASLGENLEEVKLTLGLIAGLGIVGIFGAIRVAIVGVGVAAFEASKRLHGMLERFAEFIGLRDQAQRQRDEESAKRISQQGHLPTTMRHLISGENVEQMGTGAILGSPDFSRQGQLISNKSPVGAMGKPDLLGQENAEFEKQIQKLINLNALQSITNENEREFQELLMSANIEHPVHIELLREQFDALKELEKAEEKRIEDAKILEDQNKLRKKQEDELQSMIDSTRTSQEALNDEIAEFKALAVELGQEDMPEFQIALERMEHELTMLDPLAKTLHETFDRAFEGIGRAITDSMIQGGNAMDNLKSVAKNVVDELLNEFFRLTVIVPLKNAIFGGGSGGGIGSSILGGLASGLGGFIGNNFGMGRSAMVSSPVTSNLSSISQLRASTSTTTASFMMGGRAGGGAVQRGMPTVVGERGAELFIPNSSGSIVNNANSKRMMGGGTVINQNLNINAGVAQTVRAEMLNLLPAFKQETMMAVAESRLRGGEFANAFGGKQ